jgi:hypothetical protein
VEKPMAEPENKNEVGGEFRAFFDEFKNETDRAAVIVGAAKLDYLLYQILGRYLLPITGTKDDELLEGDSPLSTFSSRINLCHRLGLIDTQFARSLHLVRKIRNTFAHEVSGCRLGTPPPRRFQWVSCRSSLPRIR